MTEQDPELLRAKLNSETARIAWSELARFHAQGSVLAVVPDLDMVEVATVLARDDSARLKQWLDGGQVAHVSDEQAQQWTAQEMELWAVVVAPWVVVQAEEQGQGFAS